MEIKELITENWGHVPIFLKIGNVSFEFPTHVPDSKTTAFLLYHMIIMFMNNSIKSSKI